jgi:hypothetical protein
MAVVKRVLCRQRLRQVPPQFSWIDHRLVRHRHICRCSHQALALYLFLITVCDGEGLSYYSDATLARLLHLDSLALARARQELISADLIAYQSPLYQVLALEDPPQQVQPPPATQSPPAQQPSPATPRQPNEPPLSIGQILQQMMERAQ